MDEIKVLIVEDDPVWLYSMVDFLNNEEDISVVATACSKDQAVEVSKITELDVILMDVNLSENNFDGIYAAAEICNFKKVKIIMLTSLDSEGIITDSFTAGAVNYISKSNYTELPAAIRSAYNKVSPIEILLKDYSRLKEKEQLDCLTPAEKEILEMVQHGYSQSKIANILYKSPGTLKSQVNKILKKLNVTNCKEAIAKIKMKGLHK